jgi:hypothetical protein
MIVLPAGRVKPAGITLNIMGSKIDYKEKREALKALSQQVKPLVKSGQYDTVNEAILDLFYRNQDHQKFNTFWEWQKEGYRVKKGSTAFTVWGSPRKLKPTDPQPTGNDEEDNKEKFFPICYLFSNKQVERRAA